MHFITSYTDTYRDKLLETVEIVAKAGADIIQFSYEHGQDRHILDMAKKVKDITAKYGCKLCVNNRIDIANIVSADYLHIGQYDIDIETARTYLDRSIKIGLTITDEGEFHHLADYYGVGPIFQTSTKDIYNTPIGIDKLTAICKAAYKPVTAIGGITTDNCAQIFNSGAADVAVIGDIYRSSDVSALLHSYSCIQQSYDTMPIINT